MSKTRLSATLNNTIGERSPSVNRKKLSNIQNNIKFVNTEPGLIVPSQISIVNNRSQSKATTPASSSSTQPKATTPASSSSTTSKATTPASSSSTQPKATTPASSSSTQPKATTPASSSSTQPKPAVKVHSQKINEISSRKSIPSINIANVLESEINDETDTDSIDVSSSDDGESEFDASDIDEDCSISDNDSDNNSSSDDGCMDDEEYYSLLLDEGKYVNKKKDTIWHTTPLNANFDLNNRSTIMSGPSRLANRMVDTILSTFELFFNDKLIDMILKWTNKYGSLKYGDNWKEINRSEFRRFIGIMVLYGVYRSKHERISNLWSKNEGRNIFNLAMSRNRYLEILQCLRFDDVLTRRDEIRLHKLQPIKEMFDLWNETLEDAYIPNNKVTVDEQLLPFRGRCPFRQFIKSKPGKYGIKLWQLCDAVTSYACKAQIYEGKKGEKMEKHQGEKVVLDLVQHLHKNYPNNIFNVTCDNFFTSLSLGNKLLSINMTILGTIRSNRSEIPFAFKPNKSREKYSTIFGFQEKFTLASYSPAKNRCAILLSSSHFNDEVIGQQKKPQMILDYNSTKFGVDRLDQMVKNYSVKRKTNRWPMAIFYNMIDISCLNAYIIWLHLRPTWEVKSNQKRRLFLIELGKQLLNLDSNMNENAYSLNQNQDGSRKRCNFCPRKDDVKTNKNCFNCKVPVCKKHSDTICCSCKNHI